MIECDSNDERGREEEKMKKVRRYALESENAKVLLGIDFGFPL